MTTFVDNTIPPSPFPVVVHHYNPSPRLTAYEYASSSTNSPPNALIFIGGLFDGPNTVDYVNTISAHLTASKLPWTIFNIRLSSSFTGFGTSSLSRDCNEISQLVTYLRTRLGKQKVALMGHSTGSQDNIHYALTSDTTPSQAVDAYILQAPASDREAIGMDIPAAELAPSLSLASSMIAAGKSQDLMPNLPPDHKLSFFPPITAYRFHSLLAPGGDDDYFSSDLDDATLAATFGRLTKPTLILESEKDEYVPDRVDKVALVKRWAGFAKPGVVSELSGVIPGANHGVHDEGSRAWLAETVGKFLMEVVAKE